MYWLLQIRLYDWRSSDSLVLIGPSWSDFSLALVLFGLYEHVCNNSESCTMGRLSDHTTAPDIIAQVHASLLPGSVLWMAAGELTKRAAFVREALVSTWPARFFSQMCMWSNHICFCVSLSVRPYLWILKCVCECLCVLRVLVCSVWGVCVHACRMTFSEMWQRERKHLTHNWSAIKERWSWICIRFALPAARAGGSTACTPQFAPSPPLKADYKAQNDTPQKWQRKTWQIQEEQS